MSSSDNSGMRSIPCLSILSVVLSLVALCGLGTAHAAEIYRWIDDQGAVHLGDRVPPAYRKSAVRVTPEIPPVTEADRNQAQARARDEQARAAAAQERAERAASAAQRDGGGSAAASVSSPSPPDADTADCDNLTRKYLDSLDCFAPYVNANGTTRAEGYAHCRAVPAPPARCGRVPTAADWAIGYPERPRHRFGRNVPPPSPSPPNDPSRGTCAVGQSPPVGSVTCAPAPRRAR